LTIKQVSFGRLLKEPLGDRNFVLTFDLLTLSHSESLEDVHQFEIKNFAFSDDESLAQALAE
jgi:hypothetical protein